MLIGMTGRCVLDDNGDREPDYWIMDMTKDGSFIKIAEVLNIDKGVRVSVNSITSYMLDQQYKTRTSESFNLPSKFRTRTHD